MPIKFDLYKNPEKEGVEVPKLHAKVITKDVITTKDLRDTINKKCTVAPADVAAVLTALSSEMFEALSNGYSVHLEGLGHFSLSLRCAPDVNPKHVSTSDISVKGIRFLPDKELSEKFKTVEFERLKDASRHSEKMELSEIMEKMDRYFTDNQFMRRLDFEKMTGFNKSKALRALKGLVNDGVLKNVGTKQMPMYIKN